MATRYHILFEYNKMLWSINSLLYSPGESIKKLFTRGKSRSTSVSSEADAEGTIEPSKQPLKEEEEEKPE